MICPIFVSPVGTLYTRTADGQVVALFGIHRFMSVNGATPLLCTTFGASMLIKSPLTLRPRKSATPRPVSLKVVCKLLLTVLNVRLSRKVGTEKLVRPMPLNPCLQL